MTKECFPGDLRDQQDAHGQAHELPHAQEPGKQVDIHVAQPLGVLERNNNPFAAAVAVTEPLLQELHQIREVGHAGGDFRGIVWCEAPEKYDELTNIMNE